MRSKGAGPSWASGQFDVQGEEKQQHLRLWSGHSLTNAAVLQLAVTIESIK